MKSGIYRRALRVRAARIRPAASDRVSQRSRDCPPSGSGTGTLRVILPFLCAQLIAVRRTPSSRRMVPLARARACWYRSQASGVTSASVIPSQKAVSACIARPITSGAMTLGPRSLA